MQKNLIVLTIAGLFLIAMLSFALAAKGGESNLSNLEVKNNVSEVLQEAKEVKNVTFGACVSDAAKQKNDCYALAKESRSSCLNNSVDKATTKKCKTAYDGEIKQCKGAFKGVKNECKKIKHSFWESAKVALA